MMLDFGVQSQSSDTRPKTSCIGSLAVDCRQSAETQAGRGACRRATKRVKNPQQCAGHGNSTSKDLCASALLQPPPPPLCSNERGAKQDQRLVVAVGRLWEAHYVLFCMCVVLLVSCSCRRGNLGVAVVVLPCLR